jgi:hypothetical protein
MEGHPMAYKSHNIKETGLKETLSHCTLILRALAD